MVEPSPAKPIVMVIDDTPANLRLLAQMLTQVGYEVRVANSGEAGLRAAKTILPDLILLDVMMPHIDGWEILQALRPLAPRVAVVSALSPVYLRDTPWVRTAVAVYGSGRDSFRAGFAALLGDFRPTGRLPVDFAGLAGP